VLIAILVAASAGAEARNVDGSAAELRRECMAAERLDRGEDALEDDLFEAVACYSYLAGVAHVLHANCLDTSYQGSLAASLGSMDQTVRAVVLWLDEHPEHWGRPRSLAAIAAITTRMPCRR
jgi:hypothetical protein